MAEQSPGVQTDDADVIISCGSKVACYVPSYSDEEPQIAIVRALPDENDEVLVDWMGGSYSSTWDVCKVKEGKDYVNWQEKIKRDNILFNIELTRSNRISSALKGKLKKAYEQI